MLSNDPRVGVYVCHCGTNIADTVDVDAVAHGAGRLPNVVSARHYSYLCSDPGQRLIEEDIDAFGLTGVVVAARISRTRPDDQIVDTVTVDVAC